MKQKCFPHDCDQRCPHFRVYETSIMDMAVYCELLDEECDLAMQDEYSIPCPKREGVKDER